MVQVPLNLFTGLAASGNRTDRISEIALRLVGELIRCSSRSISNSMGDVLELLCVLLSCIVGIPSRFCSDDGPSYASTKCFRTILSLLKFMKETEGRIEEQSFVQFCLLVLGF